MKLHRVFLVGFLLLAMIVVALLFTMFPFQQQAAGSSLSIRVVGRRLVNAQGQTIRLIGVNMLAGGSCVGVNRPGIFLNPTNTATVRAMVNWHMNVVRITLNEDCWLGINNHPAQYAGGNYQTTIEGIS